MGGMLTFGTGGSVCRRCRAAKLIWKLEIVRARTIDKRKQRLEVAMFGDGESTRYAKELLSSPFALDFKC